MIGPSFSAAMEIPVSGSVKGLPLICTDPFAVTGVATGVAGVECGDVAVRVHVPGRGKRRPSWWYRLFRRG